jgi:hypothetical protein
MLNPAGPAAKAKTPPQHKPRRRFKLPLLGSNQDSPDPVPLRLSPPLRGRAFVVWTVPSPSLAAHRCGQAVPIQSLHLPATGAARLGSALAVKRPPNLGTFTHTVSGVVSSASIARVRRVASYTKGQCSLFLLPTSTQETLASQAATPATRSVIQSQACCQLHQGAVPPNCRGPWS